MLRRLLGKLWKPRQRLPRQERVRRFVPALEQLEGRIVPSATTPQMISLNSSGMGVQSGIIETPGEVDLYAFTASVTGQAVVHVDGGAAANQELRIDTNSGQTYGIMVSDAGASTGPYVLRIDSIADDFPDATVFNIDLSKTSTQAGVINYPGDVDNFRFTATQSGVMTLKMQNQGGPGGLSTLACALSESGATVSYDVSPSRQSSGDASANDRIVQFEVVQGRQYTLRASGANGSVGSYLLSLSLAVDDFSATTPHEISLDPSTGAAAQTGSIEVPGDKDLFQFTAAADGYAVVALMPAGSSRTDGPFSGPWAAGTNMQGLLTFPATPIVPGVVVRGAAPGDSGPLEAFSGAGWLLATRDDFAAIQVKRGDTYEFFVSADQNTIGDYTLAVATYPSDAVATFITTGGNQGLLVQRSLTFDFSTVPPSLHIEEVDASPAVGEIEESFTGSTNTRLAAFALPSSNTTTPPSTVTVPGGQSTGASTVPSGQSTGASNSLIAALLIVADRDNSAPSRENTVASSQGSPNVVSMLMTTLLVGLAAPGPGPGGNDTNTDPLIRGIVFDDLDGDGRQTANEPGVAGETVLLEIQKGGRYVVVKTATTDAGGAYSFTGVKPGDYRVRLAVPAGAGSDHTTPTSHTVKVTSDGKPRTFHFGKASKRGTNRNNPCRPSNCWVMDDVVLPQEHPPFEEVDRVFLDWDKVGVAAPFLDDVERDGSASDCWLGLLAPIAIQGVAHIQWDIPAVERRPGAGRRQKI